MSTTARDEVVALALQALKVLEEFPGGTLHPLEVEALAHAALKAVGHPVPERLPL